MSSSRKGTISLAMSAVAVLALALPLPAVAQSDEPAPAIEPAAIAALESMGAYLRTLSAFQVEAETSVEEVLENGLKAEYRGAVSVLARMPDGLRADVTADRSDRQFLYDGKTFTLFAKRLGFYATVPAPATVGELADVLEEKYDISIPLVDLFRWGNRVTSEGITAAVDLGPATVDGVTCQHYAFRQEGLDWQIWIQRGDFPLPLRLVLTTTTDEARPQATAEYHWNLAPSFNEQAFTFDPPADAKPIAIAEAE